MMILARLMPLLRLASRLSQHCNQMYKHFKVLYRDAARDNLFCYTPKYPWQGDLNSHQKHLVWPPCAAIQSLQLVHGLNSLPGLKALDHVSLSVLDPSEPDDRGKVAVYHTAK